MRLSLRAESVQARAFGLADDLAVIACALDELRRRAELVEHKIDMLAAHALRKHYGVDLHPAQLDALAHFGVQSGMVVRP